MESLAQEKARKALKARLPEDDKNVVTTVELLENKYTENIAHPFISQSKVWDDEDTFAMPDDIMQNIVENLGFKKPSII